MIGKETALAIDGEHAVLINTQICTISEVYPFGRVLRSALMDEGYEAELVLNGSLHVLILVVEGVKVEVYWHCLPYTFINTEARDPFYYIIATHHVARARCNVRGILSLLRVIPTLVGRVRSAVQCAGCHYSSDKFCGMGLVGDGNCNHYSKKVLEWIDIELVP